jgi:hypothetical protein
MQSEGLAGRRTTRGCARLVVEEIYVSGVATARGTDAIAAEYDAGERGRTTRGLGLRGWAEQETAADHGGDGGGGAHGGERSSSHVDASFQRSALCAEMFL